MFIVRYSFFLLLITIVQCQDIPVTFPTFEVDTDIGSCTCDLTDGICDVSCCCDISCSSGDKQVFGCSSRENEFTNSTPVYSTVQATCFKNISIFHSNSPYIIQKMGELVCIDYHRYSGSQYYQQPKNQTLNAGDFVRTFNTQNNVKASSALPTGLSEYQVGTGILMYRAGVPIYYSLPIKLFNNQLCSGSQSITYMNDFTSTCSQSVDNSTCTVALNPNTYINPLCLFRSPSNPYDNSTYICDNTTASVPTFTSGSCNNALKSLTITIYYSNANSAGIVNVSAVSTLSNASTSVTFKQTFAVRFIKVGSSAAVTTSNPGYLQGANIIARISDGSILDSPPFSIIKPASNGLCNTNNERISIRFGENVQSTCKIDATTTNCSSLFALLMPINSTNLYVAAYSNPNSADNATDWLPVISCPSQRGIPNGDNCQIGIINSSLNGLCYTRLDIQIAYTKIGSIVNPQAVLSAVIFHYQGSIAPSGTILMTKTITFQDISATPITIQGQIPPPNARLPADFFFPFSTSHATKSQIVASLSYVLISTFFVLM